MARCRASSRSPAIGSRSRSCNLAAAGNVKPFVGTSCAGAALRSRAELIDALVCSPRVRPGLGHGLSAQIGERTVETLIHALPFAAPPLLKNPPLPPPPL